MKTHITAAERLQLIGLLALAEKHDSILTQIREAAADLVGAVDANERDGHIADAIYSTDLRDVDPLLERLHIAVRPAPSMEPTK